MPRISCQILRNSYFSAYGGNMGQQQQQQQSQPVHPGQQALHQAVHQSAGGVMNQQRSPNPNQNRNRNFIENSHKVFRRSLFAFPKFLMEFFFNDKKAIRNEIPEIKDATSNVNFVKYFSTVKNSLISITVHQSI